MRSMNGVTLFLNRVHRCIIIKGWTKRWAGLSFIQHKVNDICIANQSSQGAAVSLGCVK
jgi:hypothetical protein